MNLKYCFYELTTSNIQLIGPELNLGKRHLNLIIIIVLQLALIKDINNYSECYKGGSNISFLIL
jgi:hypothetical protein